MRSLRELERQLEVLESQSGSNMLYMTLDDGRNIKINCGSPDGMINLISKVPQNKEHPYRKYFEHAVKGHPDQGQMVLLCKALIESFERIEAEKQVI